MLIRVVALLSRQLFRLVLLCCRTSRSKDIEILVLHQEVGILRRQVNRPRVRPEERMVLAVLQRLRPAWERTSSLVTPDRLRPQLGSMRVPTLVVLAEQSRAHDVGKVRMNAETRLPYVSVVVLAGASHHSIPTTSPDQLNRELVQFLVREEL